MNREELEATIRRALTQRDRAGGTIADNAFIDTVLQATGRYARIVSESWARQQLISPAISARDLGSLRMQIKRPPAVQAQIYRHIITASSVRVAARQIGVCERTVTRWRKALRESIPAPGYPEPARQSDHDH